MKAFNYMQIGNYREKEALPYKYVRNKTAFQTSGDYLSFPRNSLQLKW